ncbi:MAG TPA: hypothetical protein VEK08_26615 [Planctomycetota bacterium]|nr:hypothetical protein [Planctomycetota bacterium]
MKATTLLCRIPLVLALATTAFSARAELDYEFAKALIERDEPSFKTDDLVEHLVSQLEARTDANSKLEGKLIKATLKTRQALTASADKRKNLLDDAEVLYREILAGDKKFKHYEVAEKEASTIDSKRATAILKAAQEKDKSNPAEARKLRQEAAATMEKIAAGYKTIADGKFEKFKPAFEKYKVWNEKENTTGDKPIPPDILKPLAATFDDWLISDKRYVATKVEQLECYDDADAAKKTVGTELAKLIKTRAEAEYFSEFPVIVAWYNYMLGRTYASVADEKQAAEAWNEALLIDPGEMAAPQKKAILILKENILHDLVKMKMRAKKYSDVEAIIVESLVTPEMRFLFEKDSGKDLLIDYAKALTLPADATAAEYEKAVKKLREMIAAETKGGAVTRWANEYRRTIAEVLDDMRKNKPNARPKLSAAEWYDAANGFFLMGQQEYKKYDELSSAKDEKAKAQFDKAYGQYQDAVDYYRRAIGEARKPKTDLVTRLSIEPKGWFEMALCYLKMGHYYEAAIAYKAMRDSYLPENRKKWMPDLTKPEQRKIAKPATELLAELDKADGLLAKSGKNILFALDKNAETHKNAADGWNKQLKPRVIVQEGIQDDSKFASDPQYQLGKSEMELARGIMDGAKGVKDPKAAEDMYAQAEAKYLAATDKFAKVKPGTMPHEMAMYQAGTAYVMAQSLWATGKFPSRMAEFKAKCEEYAKKGNEAFDKYFEDVKSIKGEQEDIDRRKKLEGAVLLARNALNSGAGRWQEVVKTADAYIEWENQNPDLVGTKSSADVALLNKFRAQIELASPPTVVPDVDVYLSGAEKTMKLWRKAKPKENKTFVYMLNALSRRNNLAAFQVEKFVKENKPGITIEMMDKYENKVADLQAERVEMIEEDKDEQPTMEDYSRLVYLFNKTRRDKKCADMCKKLLDTFDPESKNLRIPDDEKVWQEKFAKMKQLIKYSELNKMSRCVKDHQILVDYMYDTTAGVNAAEQSRRPEFDQFNSDMERARIQLETIKKNYPDCQTFDAKLGEGGKSLLAIIEDEIDFRRKIFATRELLFKKAMKVATDYDKENRTDEGKRYKEMAFKQLDILIAMKGETPETLTLKAEIAISLGNYAEALNSLNKVRIEAPDQDSMVFFDASKRVSEIYAIQKKWTEAAEYPEFLALTIGFDAKRVKERWPDMKTFLKECYDGGAKMPGNLKKVFDALAENEKAEKAEKSEDAKEEPKKEEPKTDAPAAPAAPAGENKAPAAPAAEKPAEKAPDAK